MPTANQENPVPKRKRRSRDPFAGQFKRQPVAIQTHNGGKEAISGTAGTRQPALAASQTEEVPQTIVDEDLPALLNSAVGSVRWIVGSWLTLRASDPSITLAEAAKHLEVSKSTLIRYINHATQEGWLRFYDPLDRMEHEIVPKVLDNLKYWLDQQDKTTTIESAKGTVFRTYQEAKGISTKSPQLVLALKIDMPDAPEIKAITGQILGQPRLLEEEKEE